MKVFELRAILSRIDPQAEVLVTTADPKGHGSFANPISGIGQDRTVIDSDGKSRPVLVLHRDATERCWAAKEHAKDAAENRAVYAKVRARDDVGFVCFKGDVIGDEDRLARMVGFWASFKIDARRELVAGDGWTKLKFMNKAEAEAFVEKIDGLTIDEIIPLG